MKKLILLSLALTSLLFVNTQSHAQVSVHVNIGTPPAWAPPAEAHVIRYYYIPEEDSYYDAVRRGYYYDDGGNWVFSASLPWGNVNVGNLHHVAVRYYGDQPYTYFSSQRTAYVKRYHDDWQQYGYHRPYHVPPGQAKKGYYDKQDKKYDKEQEKYDKKQDKELEKEYKHDKKGKHDKEDN
jgi:hypothetical protein